MAAYYYTDPRSHVTSSNIEKKSDAIDDVSKQLGSLDKNAGNVDSLPEEVDTTIHDALIKVEDHDTCANGGDFGQCLDFGNVMANGGGDGGSPADQIVRITKNAYHGVKRWSHNTSVKASQNIPESLNCNHSEDHFHKSYAEQSSPISVIQDGSLEANCSMQPPKTHLNIVNSHNPEVSRAHSFGPFCPVETSVGETGLKPSNLLRPTIPRALLKDSPNGKGLKPISPQPARYHSGRNVGSDDNDQSRSPKFRYRNNHQRRKARSSQGSDDKIVSSRRTELDT